MNSVMPSNCHEIDGYATGCMIILLCTCLHKQMDYFTEEYKNCHISFFHQILLRHLVLIKCINILKDTKTFKIFEI